MGGKKLSKKQMLKKVLQKERAGIELKDEERDLLYVERDEVGPYEGVDSSLEQISTEQQNDNNDIDVQPLAFPSSGRKKKKSKSKKKSTLPKQDDDEEPSINHGINSNNNDTETNETEINTNTPDNKPDTTTPQLSFAEMMMAGLSSLKTKA